MFKKIGHQFYACGRNFPPKLIEFEGNVYISEKVFKHDFFAATSLNTNQNKNPKKQKQIPQNIVLKKARTQHFLGLPMQ